MTGHSVAYTPRRRPLGPERSGHGQPICGDLSDESRPVPGRAQLPSRLLQPLRRLVRRGAREVQAHGVRAADAHSLGLTLHHGGGGGVRRRGRRLEGAGPTRGPPCPHRSRRPAGALRHVARVPAGGRATARSRVLGRRRGGLAQDPGPGHRALAIAILGTLPKLAENHGRVPICLANRRSTVIATLTTAPIRESGQPRMQRSTETAAAITATGSHQDAPPKAPMLHAANAKAAVSQRAPTTRIPHSPTFTEFASTVVRWGSSPSVASRQEARKPGRCAMPWPSRIRAARKRMSGLQGSPEDSAPQPRRPESGEQDEGPETPPQEVVVGELGLPGRTRNVV